MKLGTIYSASDKSLYDALNQSNVTNADLRSLFLSRGILVSSDSNRKHLAKHFARLFHDYRDYQALARLFGGSVQRKKYQHSELKLKRQLVIFRLQLSNLKEF